MPREHPTALSDRQVREVEYHREHAARNAAHGQRPVDLDVVTGAARRPWNAYWALYDRLAAWDVRGRRVLVPGCGFGEDAIRLAAMGAKVSAFDISPESVDIAGRRAALHGVEIDLGVMPAEELRYPDDSFDAAVFVNILHHVDIPGAMAEVRRVLRPGAAVFGDELYTHSWVQRARESWPVSRGLYPLMRRHIYGGDVPYITPDEHKIDEGELRVVLDHLSPHRAEWFEVMLGRLVPDRWRGAAKLDRALMRAIGGGGRFLAGRVLFSGTLRKGPALRR